MHRQGVGATKNSAKVIEAKHEDLFWEKSLLGYSTPKLLQRTVFFYVSMNFALRGVQEQDDLVLSQFVLTPSDISMYNSCVFYEYTELISKNYQHSFKDINKSCRGYALSGSERCIVKLLDTYLSLLPSGAPYLYMRVLDKFPTEPNTSVVTNQRVGVNLLKKMLPDLSEKSRIGVRYTNHSLRANSQPKKINDTTPILSQRHTAKGVMYT